VKPTFRDLGDVSQVMHRDRRQALGDSAVAERTFLRARRKIASDLSALWNPTMMQRRGGSHGTDGFL